MAPAHNPNNPDYYALLGVTRESSLQEIKTAFRRLSMMTHPDRGGSNEDQTLINHVYEVLSNPMRRRRYDATLIGKKNVKPAKRHEPEPERRYETARTPFKSSHAEAYEQALRKKKVERNIRERVRDELKRKTEGIKSGFADRVGDLHGEACRTFKGIRIRCLIFISAAVMSFAAGIFFPILWFGALPSVYLLIRHAWYGSGEDAIFVLHPEWDYVLKKQIRRRVRLLIDAELAYYDCISIFLDRLIAEVRKSSRARDPEKTVLRRMLIHFFLLGYAPVNYDPDSRIAVLSDGPETIAVRCRHRAGAPVNAGFIKTAYEYMGANGIQRGFLFASPGLSKNAAISADNGGIAYYSIKEINAWIEGMSIGRYPGPCGDSVGRIDDFMKFLEHLA